MIEGFAVQPYPLWAVVVLPDQWEPLVHRVVGWRRPAGARPDELRPVIEWGAKTIGPREIDDISYYDSKDEAERRGPVVAEAFRQFSAEEKARAGSNGDT